ADALFALRALDDPSERRATSAPGVGDAPWSAAAAPWSASARSWAAPDEPAPELASRPPIPESWRSPEAPSLNLLGAGLGLYFLRPVPLVDREAQREAPDRKSVV